MHAYGFIRLAGGYAERIREGFAIHFAKNHAIILKSEDVVGAHAKIKPLQDYHFIRLTSLIELGSEAGEEKTLVGGFLLSYFGTMIGRYLENIKPYLRVRNDVNVYIGEEAFNVYFSGTVVFNLFMIIISVIKICVGKITYAYGKGR